MKKIAISAVAVLMLFFVYSCGEKTPTKDENYVPNTRTSTPGNTATNTTTYTITLTSTFTPSKTVTPTNTETGTETSTPTCTITSTFTVTPTNTPMTSSLVPGAQVGCFDTYISKVSTGNNYGGCPGMEVGVNVAGTDVKKGLLRYGVTSNFASVPTVVAINLKLTLNAAPVGSGIIEAHKLTEGFVEGKFCDAASTTCAGWSRSGLAFWATLGGSYESASLGSVSFNSSMTSGTVLRIPLPASIFSEWFISDATNYGVALTMENMAPSSDTFVYLYSAGVSSSWNPSFEVIFY